MTTRLLPYEEWSRLDGTELEPILAQLGDGRAVDVLVIERDGVIVGRWLRVTMQHVECLWIDPTYRKRGSVFRRLVLAMRAAVRAQGASSVITGAASDEVRALLAHAGAVRLPDQFALPVEG